MNELISGIGISAFRSFGKEIQVIGPFSKINLLIGKNNSGKSNVLLYLNEYLNLIIKSIKENSQFPFVDIDRHIGIDNNEIIVWLGYSRQSTNLKGIFSGLVEKKRGAENILNKLLDSPIVNRDTNLLWLPYTAVWGRKFEVDKNFIIELARNNCLQRDEWYSLWNSLTGSESGDLKAHWIPQTISNISSRIVTNINIVHIPAIRKVMINDNPEIENNSGVGIIEKLAQLQNPNYSNQGNKEKFRKINQFLKEVTDNPTSSLEIPYERDNILVNMDEKTLPLSSLGTGIQELIILASHATINENSLLCIEEPELHMHPILQKRLIKYLQEKTENQYFISTHSAHILDTLKASIFHITLDNGSSKVKVVNNDYEKFTICTDLGYKASDLLQTNCIIWVEGPSDRIYLNYWIKSTAPNFIEGLHYSVMFYGGRLLSHLTADDTEVNEFIALRKLNMNLAIVIDSDKPNKSKSINETKKRIKNEFDTGPGFAWITSGREIENYIDSGTLTSSISSVHPSAVLEPIIDQFSDCLQLTNRQGKPFPPDKIKIANKVVETPPNLEVLDLKKQMVKLVKFIEKANSL